MKELALKYGCNPNQKPSRIYMDDGRELPIEVINGRPGYINFLDAFNSWQLVKELKAATGMPAAASFKHVSPAGAAIGLPLSDTLKKIYFVDDVKFELSPLACAYARARGADRMCSYALAAVEHGHGGGVVTGVKGKDGHGSLLRLLCLLRGLGRSVLEFRPDEGAQNTVDKGDDLGRLVALGQLHRGVDGGGVGNIGHIQHLVHGGAHDGGGHAGDALEAPALGIAGDVVIQLIAVGKGAPDQVADILGLLLVGELGVNGLLLPQLGKALGGQLLAEQRVGALAAEAKLKDHVDRDLSGVVSCHGNSSKLNAGKDPAVSVRCCGRHVPPTPCW